MRKSARHRRMKANRKTRRSKALRFAEQMKQICANIEHMFDNTFISNWYGLTNARPIDTDKG